MRIGSILADNPSDFKGCSEMLMNHDEFHQVYLRYQDTLNQTVTFNIDDSGVIENEFTPSHVDPKNLTRTTHSRLLVTPIPFVTKPILQKEVMVILTSTLDNA